MYQKLFILATIAFSAINAHPGSHHIVNLAATAPSVAQTFKVTSTFPAPDIVPTAKSEWLELIKNINITKAPVYKPAPGMSPAPEVAGQDPYCDWTFTGCFGKQDLYQCPKVNVKVTFFMVGGQVVKFPDYALRAYRSGHELAMHTWSHSFMTTLTNEQIVAELKWNELAIKEVTGVSPRYFRPPYGDIDNRVRDVAAALGFIPIIWNHDTNDWAAASNPATFMETWIDGNVTQWAANSKAATVGGVSLEHDLYEKTVSAAIRVLPILQKEYKLTPVGICNNVQMYKEGNTTTTISAANTTTVANATTIVPKKTTSTAVVPASSPTAVKSPVVAAGVAGSDASAIGVSGVLSLGVAAIAAIALL